MVRLLAARLLAGLATLFVAATLMFAAVNLLPGDLASIALGEGATPQQIAEERQTLGLDHPEIVRYGDWLYGLVRLNLGRSAFNQVPITQLVRPRLVNSAILLGLTSLILIPLSLVLGTIAALREGSRLDLGIQVITLLGHSVPEFVVGAVLVLVFAVTWHLLPAVSFAVTAKGLILPVATLLMVTVAYCARIVRAGVIDVLNSEYVQMARLKGMPERLVVLRHVLPNALVPSFHVFALTIAWMTGGLVIVENLFGYPGVGQALVGAVDSRDVPLVEALVLIVAAVYVGVNLIADLLTIAANPRIRTLS